MDPIPTTRQLRLKPGAQGGLQCPILDLAYTALCFLLVQRAQEDALAAKEAARAEAEGRLREIEAGRERQQQLAEEASMLRRAVQVLDGNELQGCYDVISLELSGLVY